jgi:O-succinylbenzoic acid--CoA ligase
MLLPVDAGETTSAPISWATELETLARRYSDRIAVRDGSSALTYTDLFQRALVLARLLADRGVGSTSDCGRVGVLLRNSCAAIVADYAVSIAGGCIVHLNPAYSSADLNWCIQLASIDCLITEEALSGSVIRWSVHKWLLSEDGSVLDAAFDTPKTQRLTNDLPVVNPFSEARVIFTSGSSGSPKAAVYSHRQRWMAALVLRSVLPYRPDARIWTVAVAWRS